MDISLHPVAVSDLPIVKKWYHDIEGHQYTTRYSPKAFDGTNGCKPEEYAYYIITVDNRDAGVIWLEKNSPNDSQAVLGIMLGQKELLGQSIGQQAIKNVSKEARTFLTYNCIVLTVRKTNTRALRCYQKAGFHIIGEGKKIIPSDESIPYFKMTKKIID